MTLMKVNDNLSRSFDGMMRDFFNDFPSVLNKNQENDYLHFPPVNIVERPGEYELHVAAPGFKKEDFNVSIDQRMLTISTEKKEDTQVQNENKMIRREFSYRAFKRSFTLNEKINSEAISAKYENGILTLILPKKEEVKQSAREINIQ